MANSSEADDKYRKASAERKKHVDGILSSRSSKKVVVAGPGTGKTYLFKEILKGKANTLTLTFVKALVEDLSLELYDLSDVRTLHSFARNLLTRLWKKKEVNIFSGLSDLIEEDAKLLMGVDLDFKKIFHTRDDKNENIEFYKARKEYYDDSYGYSDIIYAAVKYLEANHDKIPAYEQIVVDEFQDFNPLEVSLVELLAEKSPVLLAGDDDQALYDFKHASPEYIRHKHGNKSPDYEAFNLPFCSRCPRVVVGAANDIVENAKLKGYLKNRIEKPYVYFEDEQKDVISENNPKIIYSQPFATQIPWFIETKIKEIAAELRAKFSVLIISPTKVQSRIITNSLKDKGFENIDVAEQYDQPPLISGLKILAENDKSNLGWRIIAGVLMSQDDLKKLLKQTQDKKPKALHELIDARHIAKTKEMMKALKKLEGEKPVDEPHMQLLKEMGIDPYEKIKVALMEELNADSRGGVVPAIRKIPIKATTVESSKGLSADYVFITHFDNQYFVKQEKKKLNMIDRDIYKFLVALTRAKSKVFLISSRKEDPIFLQWMKEERIQRE